MLTPLEDGELKTKIVALASSNSFPLDRILVGSRLRHGDSENHNLVCMSGIRRKCIILHERLTEQFSNVNERAAMVVREISHWTFSHPMYDFVIAVVVPLIYLGLFDYVSHSSDLYSSFGFDERSEAVGIFLCLYVIFPANCLHRFAYNAITRSNEFKVDAFARQQGYGPALRACLLKLKINILMVKEVGTDLWFSAYRLSHPSFTERMAALNELDMKKD